MSKKKKETALESECKGATSARFSEESSSNGSVDMTGTPVRCPQDCTFEDFMPEYDDLARENVMLKAQIDAFAEESIELNQEIDTLKSTITKSERQIKLLEGALRNCRSRTIIQIIKQRWFGL